MCPSYFKSTCLAETDVRQLFAALRCLDTFSRLLDEKTFNGITGTKPLKGNINTRFVMFKQNPLKFLAGFKKTEISLKLLEACLRMSV